MLNKFIEAIGEENTRLREKRHANEAQWKIALIIGDDAELGRCLQVLDDIQEESKFLERLIDIFKT